MMKNKSYFPKILKDFWLTLFVPIICIILLYFQAEGIVKEQILLSNKNTLNQFFETLDATLYEMRNTSYLIANDEACSEYAEYLLTGSSRFVYRVSEMIDEFSVYKGEKYTDLFVYYPGNGYIISAYNSSLDAEEYYSVYYGQSVDSTVFWEMLDSGETYTKLHVMKRTGGLPYLCMITKKGFRGNPDKDFFVVQIMSPDYLKHIIGNEKFENGGLLLFDENRKLLVSEDGREDYHMEGYEGSDIPYAAKAGGDGFMMQVKKAESIGGYYAFATPEDYFWRELSNLRLLCTGGIILSVIISLFIGYRGSRRAYSPLEKLVDKVEEHDMLHYDSNVNSEVDFINKILENAAAEKKNLSKIGKRQGRERFLASLLQGNLEELDTNQNDFEKNGMELCSDRFIVSIIAAGKNADMDSRLQEFAIINVIEELFNREGKGYAVKLANHQYAAIFNLRKDSDAENLHEIWTEGQQFLNKHFKLLLTVAYGEVHEGMLGIHESCQEAEKALRYQYLLGEGSCIGYEQIKNRDFSYSTSVESKLSKMIIGYMKNSAPVRTPEEFVEEILAVYGIGKTASMDTVACFKYEVFSVLNKAMMTNRGVFDNPRDVVEELLLQSDLDKFKQRFSAVLALLWQKEQQSVEQEDICRKVQKYIQENFRNPMLSVNMLGEEMNMSASYMSKLFREKYNISVPDYISQIRIKGAKEDLGKTQKSVKQIAEENGFLSSTVFINTFKKWEGITPGNYRNLSNSPDIG